MRRETWRSTFLVISDGGSQTSEQTSIVLADDHTIVRGGLRMLLDAEPGFEVVAEAADVDEALRKVLAYKPDVIVLDLSMPGGSSLKAIGQMLEASPDTAIVVLTTEDDPRFAREALREGALAFVLKEAADSELVEAVRGASNGARYLNPKLGAEIAAQPDVPPGPPDNLTEREVEVLRLVALGYTNAEISEKLYLSVRTVESHRANIQQKSGRTTRAQLVAYAQEQGLLGGRSGLSPWAPARQPAAGPPRHCSSAMVERRGLALDSSGDNVNDATRAVLTVARSVLERLDIEVVLDRVLNAARELAKARYAALGVLDESRTELARFLTLGIDDHERRAIGPLPTGRGVLGELIADRRPLRVADVGSHPHSYGVPVGHPPMKTFLGVPIMIEGEPFGNLYLTEKEGGGEFTETDQRAVMMLADFAGVAIDHANRFSGSEAKRRDLQRTVDSLDATLQIARALGGQTELASILEMVAKRGRALVSARALVIELVVDDQLELAAGAGELPADLLGQRVPLANTVASAALRSGQSQRLIDQLNHARFEQHGLGHLGLNAEDGLVVPLVFRGRAYGVLVAVDHLEGGDFTAEHQQLLEAFAASAATAVATAHSVADERRRQRLAVTEGERARWARELHDETLQALGSLRLTLAAAARSGTQAALGEAVARSLDQLDYDIASLRGLIAELRPAALDQLGLEPAVLALVDRVRGRGVEIDAQIDLAFEHGRSPHRLLEEFETGIYRIVQEALTNAVNHGQAKRAIVELLEEAPMITVMVRDDGVGFDTTSATRGFGLLGMHERVELLDGELRIESAPGEGTRIHVTLPARHRDEDPVELLHGVSG